MFSAAHLLFLAVRLPRTVTVSTEVLTVQYTLWKRLLPYPAISNIELNGIGDSNSQSKGGIRIVLATGRSIVLTNIREGTPALYQVLRAAWEQNHSPLGVPLYPSEPTRKFPAWLTPAAVALALFVAFVAPSYVWRQPGWIRSVPDARVLATFPQVHTG